MTILNNVAKDFVTFLSSQSSLADVKIIDAYPYVVKPTILKTPVVAVSLGNTNLDNIAIGDNCAYGTYELKVCIFSPYRLGADMLPDIASKIFSASQGFCPLSIATNEISVDTTAQCFKLKCSINFSDCISFGGGDSDS